MARPVRIHDAAILEAAREIFLSKGVQATTAEVAARAGISEGSLFKRFRSKDELFAAAMRPEAIRTSFLTALETADPDEDLREVLVRTGVDALQFFHQILPLLMMSWSHSCCTASSRADAHSLSSPDQMRRSVELLEREIARGRLNPRADAMQISMAFFGAISNYAFFQVLHGESFGEPETYIRELLHTLWQGIGPRPQPPAPTRKPRTRNHHA